MDQKWVKEIGYKKTVKKFDKNQIKGTLLWNKASMEKNLKMWIIHNLKKKRFLRKFDIADGHKCLFRRKFLDFYGAHKDLRTCELTQGFANYLG